MAVAIPLVEVVLPYDVGKPCMMTQNPSHYGTFLPNKNLELSDATFFDNPHVQRVMDR